MLLNIAGYNHCIHVWYIKIDLTFQIFQVYNKVIYLKE